jgi:hypothetical protein
MKKNLPLCAIVLFICGCGFWNKKQPVDKTLTTSCRVILTSSLNSDSVPTSDVKKISLASGKLYIYVKWFDISQQKHRHEFRVYDSKGKLVFISDYKFTPELPIWNTWAAYSLNPNIDLPGTWRIDIYLDGKLLTTKKLEVFDPESPKKSWLPKFLRWD